MPFLSSILSMSSGRGRRALLQACPHGNSETVPVRSYGHSNRGDTGGKAVGVRIGRPAAARETHLPSLLAELASKRPGERREGAIRPSSRMRRYMT